MTPVPRLATPDDLEPAADVLAAAFHDYPWTRYVVPEEDYAARLRGLQRLYLAHALEHGILVVSGDHDGVIALLPSDAPAPAADVVARIVELHGDRVERLGSAATEAAGEETWTLETLGVRAEARGRGVGSALIARSLRLATERGAAAVRLETSDERNVRLYERHGFHVSRHVERQEAPPVWHMRWVPAADAEPSAGPDGH
ncbi:GNAT family N-acetyltransferase [Streptomyces sp. SID7958]|uniref:GNAT family N-acetyltransferase n=2 Tax=unclassified Streptomyces TaxID=2593676 RepID=A0A6G3QMX0_9ACTN|nr:MULTISPECIES: GNAT family N-acetyltransferase [unclassified Streptomyces]NEA84721.1 GNAT family N-acetyltransferase [Streptomyces sp. SID14436]NEC77836.1 GNAT family N-acetyltransferase [Streptomyces sp. SID7958]